MKIYGGHDFYDCALSLGIDPTIVFVRNKSKHVPVSEVGVSLLGDRMEIVSSERTLRSNVDRVSVVFCGKLYRGASYGRNGVMHHFWSASKMQEFIAQEKDGKVKFYSYSRYRLERKTPTLEDYFNPVAAPKNVMQYMIDHKVAILVEYPPKGNEEPVFQVNPIGLKQIGFAKAIDPYTAFQELSMWIGGVLGGTSPEMVRITDDNVLIQNHGFDKHSFRSSSRVA